MALQHAQLRSRRRLRLRLNARSIQHPGPGHQAGTLVWLVSRTVYDEFGRVLVSTDQFLLGGADPVYATLTEYDELGRAHKSTRLEGVDVSLSLVTGHSSLDNPGTPLYTTQTIYDDDGRVSQQIAADGQTTSFEYDDLGRQIATISHPLPAEEVGLTSQPAGTLVSLRSETVYDAEGRAHKQRTNIRQIIPPTGPQQTDATDVQETTYEYDERGNVVKTTFADSTFITAAYDEHGRKTSETNQLGQTRSFTYDDAGRLTQVTLPDLDGDPLTTGDIASYQYGYDARGNQVSLTDPLGRVTEWAFDALGRQVSRTLPLGFGPDGIEGTPDDATLPEGDFRETMQYDERGRVQLAVSFEGVVARHVYDAYGRLAERQFFDNLTQYNSGAGTPTETVEYTYDAFGRRVEVAAPGRTVTSTYDALGRLASESGPEGTVSYTYDALGRLTSTIVGAAASPERITSYTYDALGRLKTVTEDRDATVGTDPLLTTTYAYDLLGNLDEEIAANGVITDYVYDDLNRLDEMVSFVDDGTVNGTYDSGSDTLIASFDYTVREDGKRTAVTETFGTGLTNAISWEYDALGRLTSEHFDSSDNSLDFYHEYDFDLTGNREEWRKYDAPQGTLLETVSYTYDANDRLLSEELDTDGQPGAEQTTTYGYSHTQQTSKTVVAGAATSSVATFSYNLQGRMSSVLTETYSGGTLQSRQQVAYGYDDAGLRVSSQESADSDLNGSLETLTSTTTYLFDSQNHTGYQQVLREVRVDEQTGESTVIDYTFGHDEIVQTRRDFDDQGNLVSEVSLVFGHDGHGSVRVLTDLLGAIASVASVTQIFHFDAYGNAHGFNPSQAATSLLYSGEHFDSRIGQQYLRARWYDPNTGRFNRLDPFFGNRSDPQSFHKYLYTHADPVNGIDPTGLTVSAVGQVTVAGAQSNAQATHNTAVISSFAAVRAWSFIKATEFVIAFPTLLFYFELFDLTIQLLLIGIDAIPDSYANPTHGSNEPIVKYEVGEYDDLVRRRNRNNQQGDFEIHHAPQQAIARRTIPGYSPPGTGRARREPAIAIPGPEHAQITQAQRTNALDRFQSTPSQQDLVVRDLWHVRRYTQATAAQLKNLAAMIDGKYPSVFAKMRGRRR